MAVNDFLSGYVKRRGHVVLEKAVVKGVNIFYTLCGDILELKDESGRPAVDGTVTGRIASGFQRFILPGISEHGAGHICDMMQSAPSDASGNALTGERVNFGSGCAGILAASDSAYVWTAENSGMCIMRISKVLGKSRIIKCISSEVGGEDMVSLSPGTLLMACPEKWADASDDELRSLQDAFENGDISDDRYFDRVLGELADESFEGCMAALAVRSLD